MRQSCKPMKQNNMTIELDQNDLLIYEISDEALETAAYAGNEKAGIFTQWLCTTVYFCPSP
jgi:hypothetical protein